MSKLVEGGAGQVHGDDKLAQQVRGFDADWQRFKIEGSISAVPTSHWGAVNPSWVDLLSGAGVSTPCI